MLLTSLASALGVTVYPVEPDAAKGAPYRLTAGTTEIPLDQLGDRDFYGRCTGLDTAETQVLLDAKGKIEAHVEPPARLAPDMKVGEDAVTFTASGAGPRVIRIRQDGEELPQPLLIVDSPETSVTDRAAPGCRSPPR